MPGPKIDVSLVDRFERAVRAHEASTINQDLDRYVREREVESARKALIDAGDRRAVTARLSLELRAAKLATGLSWPNIATAIGLGLVTLQNVIQGAACSPEAQAKIEAWLKENGR